MESKYTLPLKELTYNSKAKAGGKGAALAEMFNSGIPVPPGFVVLTTLLNKCLRSAPRVKEKIEKLALEDFGNQKKIEQVSRKIRFLVENLEISPEVYSAIKNEYKKQFKSENALVAVRSSAVSEDSSETSWAGELESYTNVNKENLLASVKKCWASMFTPRALYYRFERKAGFTDFDVAVVVQKMVQSERAGVCFTVNPITKQPNEMTIEAAYGLGEAVVLGHVTPDRYTVDKTQGLILDIEVNSQNKMLALNGTRGDKWKKVPKQLSQKQKLYGKEIIQLCQICKSVEKHFGFPCDIEWAFENGKFYIVQSRPITTLKQIC